MDGDVLCFSCRPAEDQAGLEAIYWRRPSGPAALGVNDPARLYPLSILHEAPSEIFCSAASGPTKPDRS
ncbi:hypothetical protein ACC740_38060, partial [Rhizobium ruizarguesonis]